MTNAEKDIDEAIIELAAVATKVGVPTDVIAEKLVAFGSGLYVAEVGTDETASRLEDAAKSVRKKRISPELKPPGILPPLVS